MNGKSYKLRRLRVFSFNPTETIYLYFPAFITTFPGNDNPDVVLSTPRIYFLELVCMLWQRYRVGYMYYTNAHTDFNSRESVWSFLSGNYTVFSINILRERHTQRETRTEGGFLLILKNQPPLIAKRKWRFRDLGVTFPSCTILWLRGCELQVHPRIDPRKQQNRRMGVPNLRRDAPSRSFSRSLWSSQVLWGSQPLGVNEKVATSDRTPSVMTARLEYL